MGPVRVTREVNTARLATGATITNNLVARNGLGGIRFSGAVPDPTGVGPLGAVPFGRIVNNTIVGRGNGGVGIQVDENASPTVLNNIVSELQTGVAVDATSLTTVLGGTLYKGNVTDAVGLGRGSSPLVLAANDPLFVDSVANVFYLAGGSRAIDSSINSLQDRPEFVAVKSPLGVGLSPILAPDLDALGQTRVDDPLVSPPSGQGANVFKDRGALDRADFSGPTAVLVEPQDNDGLGVDGDTRASYVELTNTILTSFSIQLVDGLEPNRAQAGSGADDDTVRGNRVAVFRDNEKLTEGVDYSFAYDATNNIIRLTPLAGIWEVNRIYEIELSNEEGFVIATPDGASVNDGDSFTVTEQAGRVVRFEYDSGFNLTVPQTLTLQIPAAGGAAVADGQTFTVGDGTRTVVFEFDKNGAVPSPSNTIILISDKDSSNELANKIVTALSGAGLGLSPVNILNYLGRAVQLGSKATHTLDTTNTSLTQTGQAAGIEDGQTFTIDDGTKVVTFEFTDTGVASPGNVPVVFSATQTREQIADAIVLAVRNGRVGLTPTHAANSDGLVHLGGTTRHQIDVSLSKLGILGQPGVQPAWGLRIPTIGGVPDYTQIKDGETFSITNGASAPVTFELDDNGLATPGNRPIVFSINSTAAQLAAAIAIAIRNANVGLTPTSSADGVVTLGGTVNHRLTMTNTSLVEMGRAGVPAAEPVLFVPGDTYVPGVPVREPIFDEKDMALVVRDAINAAVTKGRLTDVTATVRTDGGEVAAGEVLVQGAADVTGSTVILRPDISDVAGNPLNANRNDGTTRFTISMGSGLDFGDAPESYGTLEASNGARHQVVNGFYLGTAVDADFDGQPTDAATGDDNDGGDDEDGVVFLTPIEGDKVASIRVTASAAGVLDAWIDFGRDGDWFDAGEKLVLYEDGSLTSLRSDLQPGQNTRYFKVPRNVSNGSSYSRFRFSSGGGLSPTGLASDGEVEDHAVTLIGNSWHNSANPVDVSGDGYVTPLDALLVVNDLNKNGSRSLAGTVRPAGGPYLDVTGDKLASPLDVLLVINALNSASGEGEESPYGNQPAAGEGEASGTSLATRAVVLADPLDTLPRYLMAPTLVDHRLSPERIDEPSRRRSDVESLAVAGAMSTVPETMGSEVLRIAHDARGQDLDDTVELLGPDMAAVRSLSVHEQIFADFA